MSAPPSSDPIREEAQRLIAAALTAAAAAASQTGGRFANGSPECCVCPICRVIAAMREPDPDLAGRLAAGAGDLAVGVAGLLRSLATPSTRPTTTDEYGNASYAEADEPWHAATTGASPTPPPAPKPMAKKAVKKAAKKAVKKAAKKAAKPAAPKAEDE